MPEITEHTKIRVFGINGMEPWNGTLEWNTGIKYWNERSITQHIKQDKHMYVPSLVLPLQLWTMLSLALLDRFSVSFLYLDRRAK